MIHHNCKRVPCEKIEIDERTCAAEGGLSLPATRTGKMLVDVLVCAAEARARDTERREQLFPVENC